MVPPCSDRVSRAPPYSRTDARPYPYGAVTRSGAPFQALPVRVRRPLAWSAFARRYWRSRGCFPFLRLVRYFSSPGSPHAAMDSPRDTAQRAVGCPIRRSRDHRALAPPPSFSQRATSFIASRCQGIHPMPFRCLIPLWAPRAGANPHADAEGCIVCDRTPGVFARTVRLSLTGAVGCVRVTTPTFRSTSVSHKTFFTCQRSSPAPALERAVHGDCGGGI